MKCMSSGHRFSLGFDEVASMLLKKKTARGNRQQLVYPELVDDNTSKSSHQCKCKKEKPKKRSFICDKKRVMEL